MPAAGYSVTKSQALLEQIRRVEALVDGRPNIVFGANERIGGYPIFVERASGPYLWDVDGNRYIDFLLGYGSVILGHANPAVVSAVVEETTTLGANPTLLNKNHLSLAERIVAVCPGVEAVTFLKTGSDATGAAVRLARAITQRSLVLRWGMNGWHDWCAPVQTGVPSEIRQSTIQLRYNDWDHARELFAEYGRRIACVIMMPFELEMPDPGYLLYLREQCAACGALFIFDEIRSGFRVALGGAQAMLNVEADLVTYGKALGNGYPITCLGGKASWMRSIVEVGLTVTYFRGPESFAAGVATIDEIVRLDAPGRIRALGIRWLEGLDRAAHDQGIPARSFGLPWTPFLKFSYATIAESDRALRMFCNGMLSRGVLLSPSHHWFICASMTDDDIDYALEAAQSVFRELRR